MSRPSQLTFITHTLNLQINMLGYNDQLVASIVTALANHCMERLGTDAVGYQPGHVFETSASYDLPSDDQGHCRILPGDRCWLLGRHSNHPGALPGEPGHWPRFLVT